MTTFVLVVGLACASSAAWAVQQKGGQREAEGLKPLGRLGEHAFLLVARLGISGAHYEPGSGRFRRLSRADAAEGIWVHLRFFYEQALQAHISAYESAFYQAQRVGRGEEIRTSHRCSQSSIAAEYWRFELLLRELTPEILATGVTQDEIDESIRWFRSLFAAHGVELYLPNGAWFLDVPEGHWADAAIHNLRRAGILHGYPQGTYKP